MRVINKDWLRFKADLVRILDVFSNESNHIIFPDFDDDEFSLQVNETLVNPVFVKKGDMQRVEYDFTLTPIKIRTLAFSQLGQAMRIEITLKQTSTNA